MKTKNDWLKTKGYLHVRQKSNVREDGRKIYTLVTNPEKIATHAFYPLIHSNIIERKYKKIEKSSPIRSHVRLDDSGNFVKTAKVRPLHYASNLDAIIFGYYATILQRKYEEKLIQVPGLSDSVIAYRQIPLAESSKCKGTIHFAKELFDEIKLRTKSYTNCVALLYDIKSFFPSLDHQLLKKAWCDILDQVKLPNDHFNVFMACTNFSYIYLDDFRLKYSTKGRKRGFDEKTIAKAHNSTGITSFFASPKEFRAQIRNGHVKLHKYPFRNELKMPTGIPQGLAISAVLANFYLMDFDKTIIKEVVEKYGGYYRRYSDDLIILCSYEDYAIIDKEVNIAINSSKVEISQAKTEIFLFKNCQQGKGANRVTSMKMTIDGNYKIAPLSYLGFEFNGYQTLIISSNIAKFYRRLISAVRRKCKRAKQIHLINPNKKLYIHRRQLYKLFSTKPTIKAEVRMRMKRTIKISTGEYRLISWEKNRTVSSNYFTYVTRASEIMGDKTMLSQLGKHKKIFNQAIKRHLK